MKNLTIGLLDSGVGGISILKLLVEKNVKSNFIYFGDNLNAPYGNRTEGDLLEKTVNNINYLQSCGADAIIVACNTISMSILGKIKKIFDIPIFGVFPPVVKLNEGERALLIATPLTAKKYDYSYPSQNGLDVVGLPRLAKDIELNVNNVDVAEHLQGLKNKYDTVILGCTHYFFIKNEIFDHLKPKKIISGNEFTVNIISKFIKDVKSLEKQKEFQISFVGENSEINKNFWKRVVKNNEK